MAARRWSPSTRYWVYLYLAERDGDACALCARPGPGLDIDHIDGRPGNNAPLNLRLLCRRCNVQTARNSPTGRNNPTYPTEAVHRARNERVSESASAEMRAAAALEPAYRSWVLERVATDGHISVEEAIHAGAETVGCSPTTARRYLAKLTSSAGPLRVVTDLLGYAACVPRIAGHAEHA